MESIQNEVMETIMHRRAIRRFETKQLEEAALQQILQAGLYAPSAGGRQGVLFVVCQDKEVNGRLGKIKRANSNPHMATATSYVSKEQPSIADDPNLKNAFYDAPTVITMFGSDWCLIVAGNERNEKSISTTLFCCLYAMTKPPAGHIRFCPEYQTWPS